MAEPIRTPDDEVTTPGYFYPSGAIHGIMSTKRPGVASTTPAMVNTWVRGTDMADSTCSVPVCDRPARATGGMCNAHRVWSHKHGGDIPTHALWPRGDTAAILRRASVLDPATGCLNWSSYRDPKGYGRFKDPTTGQLRAHRVAWVLSRGPIPDGMTIDHLCRNTSCVNVEHMELVTASENSKRRWRA